jgi:hypothetical protein
LEVEAAARRSGGSEKVRGQQEGPEAVVEKLESTFVTSFLKARVFLEGKKGA